MGTESQKLSRTKENRKATINDVASMAGVSPGTVSHALNNIGYVNEHTREKIMEAVEALGYVPNRAGRILKTAKTGLVMIAIPDNSNEIYMGMVNAFQEAMKRSGYSMLLYYTGGQYDEEMKAIQLLKERLVDGLFLVHFYYTEEMLREIISTRVPVVLCGMCNHVWANRDYPFDTVSIDVYKGIYAAVRHLIRMGYKKIGYLAGRSGLEVYKQRHQAYCDALSDGGIEYREDYVRWGDYSKTHGYNSSRSLYMMEDRPEAISAANDHQLIGCWNAINELGGKVPGDMAMTGMDDLEISKILELTSLNMKEAQVGEEAAGLLLRRLEAGDMQPHQDIYFQPELVIRESSLSK